MPPHNRAILSNIAIQNLNPKKTYKHTGKNGLLLDNILFSKDVLKETPQNNLPLKIGVIDAIDAIDAIDTIDVIDVHINQAKAQTSERVVEQLEKQVIQSDKQLKKKAGEFLTPKTAKKISDISDSSDINVKSKIKE